MILLRMRRRHDLVVTTRAQNGLCEGFATEAARRATVPRVTATSDFPIFRD